MSDDDERTGVEALGSGNTGKALARAAETTQLDQRQVGITVGHGIAPPYPPEQLAALLELNGTHAIAVQKKAQREVGFGFDIVPHDRVDPEQASDEELELAEDFWFGRDTIWKVGPKGTPAASPTEAFEQARQDYHGIGWLTIELIYTADDRLAGLAHLPARTVRVRKDTSETGRTAGHGFVQVLDGQTRYFAEAGDRYRTDVDGTERPIYVDQDSGEVLEGEEDRPDTPANEVLFIPNPHPNALHYGIPSWVSEIETMVGDHEARRFNREFFQWDATGQYFILVEGGRLTSDARDDITELIETLRDEDGRRVGILDAPDMVESSLAGDDGAGASIDIQPMQLMGEEDASFTEYRERNEHDIAKVHEVPPQLIGVMGDANRSNIKEAIRDFVKEVIEPAKSRFAGRIYRIIHQLVLGIEDYTLEFKTRGAEAEAEEAEILATLSQALEAAWTVNELRAEAGLDPLDGPVGEMLVVEVAGGGGLGGALEEELASMRDDLERDLRAQQRIDRGAIADD